MTIEKQLTAVQKKLTTIKLKVDNLLAAFEKSETKVAKPSKAKAVKTKPAKKAVKAKPVKKAPKAKSAKKAPKASAKEQGVKVTATDQVLNIISKSEKGVDAATLVKETGFNQKKVTNIIQRTLKLGKIQRADRGIYVGVK
jgi:hypothetical protein